MKNKIFLSILALVVPLLTWSQTITVKGTVTENVFNEPVLGATVVETGTSNGILTEIKSGIKEGTEVLVDFNISGGEATGGEQQATNPFMPRPRNNNNKNGNNQKK